jgi:hypothetical protein
VKTYQTLENRNHCLFAMLKAERPQSAEPLSHAEYFKRTNQVVQKLGNEGGVTHETKTKHCLGRDDYLYLIERDMVQVVEGPSPHPLDTTLTHHLIWCFGLITGVRPESLMGSADEIDLDTAPLTWGDIHITRDLDNAQDFTISLAFRRLKGHTASAANRGHKLTQCVGITI